MKLDFIYITTTPFTLANQSTREFSRMSGRAHLDPWGLDSPSSRHYLRPPLKNMLFPVQRPDDYITAEWELYFSFCQFFFFFLGGGGQNFIIFLPK